MTEIWNLEDILGGKKPDEIIEDIKEKVEIFKSYRKKLTPYLSPNILKEIVVLGEYIDRWSDRVDAYYYMKFCENTKDSNALAKMTYLSQLFSELENETMFFSLWFMKLSKKDAKKYFNSETLSEYKYYLQEIRKLKKHTMSEKIEKILSIKSVTGGGAFSSIYDSIVSSFEFSINGEKDITQDDLLKYVHSEKSALRKKAYELLLSKFKENSTVLNEIYKNIVLNWDNESLKIRGYKKPISVRNVGNDIPDTVVETLLKVVRKNSEIFSEYFKFKHDLNKKLGAKYDFSRYHLYAPLNIKSKKKYDFNSSLKLVLDTYKKFDSRFYEAAKKIVDEKHIHSHPKTCKKGGAFCFGVDNKLTPYIFLNHTDQVRGLFTMMHEFGHGIHDVFAQKQVNLLCNIPLPIAETASIFGEMILSSRLLLDSKDNDEKSEILVDLLDNQFASITRQSYFVLFEKFAHEKIAGGATKEKLDEEYKLLLKEQFGNMKMPDIFKHEWNYVPHIHNSPFYCYAYSWGNLSVLSLYAIYKKEGKPFLDKYINILSAGGSKSPADLLATVGINPSKEEFWQGGFDIIKEEIEELKKLNS
ncbi:MAG: M3 family oligoendopeptidase [Nanoarchaeota archaeon]|nr:M3 family oligoendopeptidase [Nanoarchaeota archaeon]MBU1031199.1 M3 family oligoendopeptidase [Nanoarchaeota archaeon]MBU1850339.1 M3 family oligoendopeptidase [Nanoarchaeota archaeon]